MISRTKRRRIFYILSLVFVLVGAATVLYSQGWRLDFTDYTLQKVGAIYIRSFPSSANITLNGKPVKNGSWLLQSGTLINNLFPNKNYHVQLSLDGYRQWDQTVTIHPALVAELATAVLVPTAAHPISSSTQVRAFWTLNDDLLSLEGSKLTFDGQPLPGNTLLSNTNDFQTALTQDAPRKTYYLVQTGSGQGASLTSLFTRAKLDTRQITDLALDQEDGNKIVVYQPSRLSYLDTDTATLALLEASSSPEHPLQASPSFLAWTVKNGTSSLLRVYDKSARRQVPRLPAFNARILKTAWATANQLAVLQDDGRLYLLAINSLQLRQIASDVRDFQFNAAGTLAAAVENSALEVISLSDVHDYWRFPGFNTRQLEDITWYRDSRHLFLRYPDYTMFLDVKDEHLEHAYTFADIQQPHYDSETNRLIYIQNSALYALDLAKS